MMTEQYAAAEQDGEAVEVGEGAPTSAQRPLLRCCQGMQWRCLDGCSYIDEGGSGRIPRAAHSGLSRGAIKVDFVAE